MTSLFGYLKDRYRRNPHKWATYLGNDTWEIMDSVYTGSVTTVGGGSPTKGRSYPAVCRDPDSWRGWAVVVAMDNSIRPSGFVPEPIAIILGWYCAHANFQRTRCIDSVIDYENLARKLTPYPFRRWQPWELDMGAYPGPSIVPDARFNLSQDGRELTIIKSPTIYGGREHYALDGPDVRALLGLEEGGIYYDRYELWHGPLGNEDESRSHEIEDVSILSECTVDGLIYLHFRAALKTMVYDSTIPDDEGYEDEGYDEESPDHAECVLCLSVDVDNYGTQSISIRWGRPLNLAFPDEFLVEDNTDLVVTGGRAVLFGSYTPEQFSQDFRSVVHWDALTGGDQKSIESTAFRFPDMSLGALRSAIHPSWMTVVASGDSVFFGSDRISLCRVDLADNTVKWTADTGSNEELVNRAYIPLAMMDGLLVCLFDEQLLEIITEISVYPELVDASPTQPERLERKRGLSSLSGICTIDPASGVEINRHLFAGEEQIGAILGPRNEYRTTYVDLSSVSHPVIPGLNLDATKFLHSGIDTPEEGDLVMGRYNFPGDENIRNPINAQDVAAVEAIATGRLSLDDRLRSQVSRTVFDGPEFARCGDAQTREVKFPTFTYHRTCSSQSNGPIHPDDWVVRYSGAIYTWQGFGEVEPVLCYDPWQDGQYEGWFKKWWPDEVRAVMYDDPDPLDGWGHAHQSGRLDDLISVKGQAIWSRPRASYPVNGTPPPAVLAAPAVVVGDVIVFGPRNRPGENLEWQAFSSTMTPAWTQELLAKPGALPGVSFSDGTHIFTPYVHSGEYRIITLLADTGEILSDRFQPPSSNFVEALVGDEATIVPLYASYILESSS